MPSPIAGVVTASRPARLLSTACTVSAETAAERGREEAAAESGREGAAESGRERGAEGRRGGGAEGRGKGGVEGLPPFSLGYVNLVAAAVIIPLTVVFARVGVAIAHSIPQRVLQLLG